MAAGDIEYGKLLQAALRTVVRSVLVRAEREGLPGDHHYYISLRLDHPGTEAPPFVRQRHPEEMTIVLQHQFWDLGVDDAGFGVTLRFDGMPARLRVPWEAVVAFFDPAAEFGLRFDLPALAGTSTSGQPGGAAAGTGEMPLRLAAARPAKPTTVAETAPDDVAADETPTRPHEVPSREEEPSGDGSGKVLAFGRPRERKEPEDEDA